MFYEQLDICFRLRISHEIAVKLLGLAGPGECISNLTHMVIISSSFYMDSSIEQLIARQLNFLKVGREIESKNRKPREQEQETKGPRCKL